MVRHTRVELIDDLDDTSPAVETVTFALRGTEYEIDLNEEHRGELDDFLTRFVAAARVRRGVRAGVVRSSGTGKAPSALELTGASASEVRAWAAENGYEVSPAGRIPEAVAVAYRQAH